MNFEILALHDSELVKKPKKPKKKTTECNLPK